MKLSEILGWRKKDKIHLLFNGRYSQVALETALTSCDREIDREALAKELYRLKCAWTKWEETDGWEKEVFLGRADTLISTMPTWLKRSEG